MSTAVTSSAGRFSMNGVIFKDYINLDRVIAISLCKDRYYSRFDILFYFELGTRNASYTDETLLRVGPFSNDVIEKAQDLIDRMLVEQNKSFNIEEELLGEAGTEIQKDEAQPVGEFENQAKAIAVEAAKKMKAEGLPTEVISKVLGLNEIEFK